MVSDFLSLSPPACCALTLTLAPDDEGITSNSFGAALGLPREFHNAERFSPQEVYQQWKLVQDQWHFLKEKGQKLCSPSRAVQDWDTQHRCFLFLSLPYLFLPHLLF